MKLNDKVETTVLQFGYAPYNQVPIPIGTVGMVGAVKVSCVRQVDKCKTFNCVDFVLNGRKIRSSYHNHELKGSK